MSELKYNIKALRTEKGISKEKIAVELNVTHNTIVAWETLKSNNKKDIRVNDFLSLCKILEVSPSDLINDIEAKKILAA